MGDAYQNSTNGLIKMETCVVHDVYCIMKSKHEILEMKVHWLERK